jgi:two-component system cell cycle response regulator
MAASSLHILLVEDNPGDAAILRATLRSQAKTACSIDHRLTLGAALHPAPEGNYDIVLLDLSLPDSHGMETIQRARQSLPHLPIIVLTGMDDESVGLEALKLGAQDYLMKGEFSGGLLLRAIRYAKERFKLEQALRDLSLKDELTGLHNRRGFLYAASPLLNHARSAGIPSVLLFADLDGLKKINDTYGHAQGDLAIVSAAEVLRRTFGHSNILARLGGDEFMILGTETDALDEAEVRERIEANVARINDEHGGPFTLSISLGCIRIQPDDSASLDSLMERADKLLYEAKRARKVQAEKIPARH